MEFKRYNDYELLYLISDGCEYALDIMLEKYSIYIKSIIFTYDIYGDKINDLHQEGLLVLYSCIKRFNPDLGFTFFTYFTVSLERRFNRLIKSSYYKDYICLDDNVLISNKLTIEKSIFDDGANFFTNQLEIDIYNNCIIGDYSILQFCKMNNLNYTNVYRTSKQMNLYLKKILTNIRK